MEVEFDADLFASDEEPSAALVRRSSKGNSRRNLKENKLKGRVNPDAEIDRSLQESSGALVQRSSNVIFGSNLEENEANGTMKPETEVDRNTSVTAIRNAEVKLGSEGFGAANAEVRFGSEEFEAEKAKVAESSEVSEDERTRRRENKELINANGGSDSNAYPRGMGPSNEFEVAAIPTHSHPEAPLGPSVYYAEDEGLWKCHHCSWVYPAIKPRIELIQRHQEHCKGMNNMQALFEQALPIKHEFEEGSESKVFLDGGGESIDYEIQKAEFEKSDRVIQTTIEIKKNQKWTDTEGNWQRNCMDLETSMGAYITQSFITEESSHIEKTEKGKNALLDTHAYSEIGSAATGRNGELTINDVEKTESEGIKQHQNGNSVSEFVLKDSQHRFLSAQDETQLKERWTRVLEKSSLEGKVEDIVKILKEQQSHDLLCPFCGSCITKRVILRKRKRLSLVSYDRWHQGVNDDEQGPVSEEEHEVTDAQNEQPISNEDSEESEAYGCLACFSLFFRRVAAVKLSQAKSQSSNNSLIEQHPSENVKNSRDLVDREKESIYCLQFLYPWGHSVNRESNAGVRADFAAESSQQTTLKEAESRLQINHSASSLGIADTLQQKKAYIEASANVVTESILIQKKVLQNEDNTDMEDGKLDSQLNLGALSRKDHDVRVDFAVGTSQQKRGKEAETTSKIMPSASNFEVVDTLQQKKPVSEVSNANIVTGSILIHNGQKATIVNKGDHNEDICTGNDKLDSKLNQVEEFTRKTGHPDIGIQSSRTSTTTKSISKDSKSMGSVGITETQCTALEAANSSQLVTQDRESKQFEEHYPMNESQLKMPPSSNIPGLEGQPGEVVANNEIPNESACLNESDKPVQQHPDGLAELKESEKQDLYQEDVKGKEDQLTEQLSNGEHELVKTEQLGEIETIKALAMSPGMSPKGIETSKHEDGIRPCVVTQDQVSSKSSAAQGEEELTISEQQQDSLKADKAVRQNESYSKDYLCSCIPVSLPAWSLWSAEKSITDQELKEPLLPNIKDKETFDKAPVPSKDDSERELILPLKPDSVDSTSSLEKQDLTLAQSNVDDSAPHRSEISSDSGNIVISTHDRLETIIKVQQTDDLQPSNVITAVSQRTSTSTHVQDPNVVTEWDLLKSIVYGGLVVSITSLGVVSSAAGGKAKTLTVVAIGLANLLSGFLLLVNNIWDLHHYHPNQFIETVGHRFWFNGFVAIISYLVFGSLAPITYCFSFQRSDDKLYKFLATSLVSLVSIISLALGKARVTNKSYIGITTLYVVTGFWASIIGFFAGEYVKKLLAKWGLTTD